MVFSCRCSPYLLFFSFTGLIIFIEICALNYNKYELNTYHKEFHCPLNYFKCINSTQCILIIELCDGILNCLDGSDEQDFCESDMCRSSTCRYGCQPSPKGPLCYCPEGSTYNGTHCLDIKIPSSFLLYTTYKPFAIKGVELPAEGTHPSEIILPIYTTGQISAVAFDVKNNNIYYCDIVDQAIYRQNLKSSQKEIFLEGIEKCSGLTIDQMGEAIYWSDSSIGSINVASLYNSSVQKNLYQLKGAQPKNIVHIIGYMFWIDKNKIKMAAMDGSNEFILVEAESDIFSSLTVFNHNLYWFNSASQQVEGIDIDRIKQRVILDKLNMNIKSMIMTDDYIYWTETSKGILHMKSLKNTSKHSSFFLENLPIHITYVHIANGITSRNSSQDCVNCDLCLPMPYSQVQKFKCICQEGFHFDNETRKCKVSLLNKCGSQDYQCADGTCIPEIFICDGQQDCIDDEFEERNCKTSCLYPHHSCDNGTKCINRQEICNGKYDCDDKSDEVERCYYGISLIFSIDIPPCKQWGRCSQICHTFNTSYACDCKWGYTLSSDKFTCISKDPTKATLLLTTESEIIRYFLCNNSQITVLSGYSRITYVDYYHTSMADLLFWVDTEKKKIFRGVLKDAAIESIHIIVEEGLGMIEGLCVDWIGHNLYWVDSEYHHIEVAKFDGSMRTSLIDGVTRPKSIAVDPHVGFLFWADRSENGSVIERSLTNGYQRHIIIQCAQNGWPTGITLDITTQYIYWVDSRLVILKIENVYLPQ
ncbi:low-density lipoprotein receptor-related protein 1-like [Centruroides sculpturatus]|uniref:low-density lipoprotein receptor-related protein 1-like n=1 Tax=Centruroides sculpturatus TaxID=218467 RepID=UPI000C6E6F1B|nr:low-density lipoprotein receptor-related protein 1-like [Centruroides sculpturatus]